MTTPAERWEKAIRRMGRNLTGRNSVEEAMRPLRHGRMRRERQVAALVAFGLSGELTDEPGRSAALTHETVPLANALLAGEYGPQLPVGNIGGRICPVGWEWRRDEWGDVVGVRWTQEVK